MFEMDILFELFNSTSDKKIPILEILILLVKRIIDANYVERIQIEPSIHMHNNRLKITPDYLKLTDSGRKFMKNISSEMI